MYPSVQEAVSLHTFGRETPVDGDRLAVWWQYTRRMQDMVNEMLARLESPWYGGSHEDYT
ncbi:hypothetical protein SEA_QUARTZ_30 [Microbacterium phage Quartz]|nr:hypothetical protein SEA_QUARTZ_30 [Microbacterium phage Quartz]